MSLETLETAPETVIEGRKTLSQLMREGAKLRPQVKQFYFWHDELTGECTGSCAIGAVFEALNPEIDRRRFYGWQDLLDYLGWDAADQEVIHPVTGGGRRLNVAIFSLNDDYSWSREDIANWLESIGY
jgi:hypothetical protein